MNKNMIVVVLIVLALVGGGAFYFGQQTGLIPQSSTTTTVTTKTTATETVTPMPTSTIAATATPTPDEKAAVLAAVKAAFVAKYGQDANSTTITVSKIQGNYAQGGASDQGGGGMWFAAKVNGTWKLVWDGNGVILCSDLTNYPDFPTSMIPECYDSATDKSVKR